VNKEEETFNKVNLIYFKNYHCRKLYNTFDLFAFNTEYMVLFENIITFHIKDKCTTAQSFDQSNPLTTILPLISLISILLRFGVAKWRKLNISSSFVA
jgi:hypothetical protein